MNVNKDDKIDFQTNEWYLDSAVTDHICNDKSIIHDLKPSTRIFQQAGGNHMTTAGVGRVHLKVLNQVSNKTEVLTLHPVYYDPNDNKHLISTGTLNEKDWHVNTETNQVYSTDKNHKYAIQVTINRLQLLVCEPIKVDSSNQPKRRLEGISPDEPSQEYPSKRRNNYPNIKEQSPHDKHDYKFNNELFKELHETYNFNIELFATDDNHHLDEYYTESNSAWDKTWVDKNFYGNCPYENDTIYRMLDKSLQDFEQGMLANKIMSTYTFIVPNWPTATWYKAFMPYFEIIKTIPKGTENVFSKPRRGISDFEPVPGDPEREYAPPIKWEVLVIHRNRHTELKMTDLYKLHLQLGHANITKLRMAQNAYDITHCRPIRHTDRIMCPACLITKYTKDICTKRSKGPHDTTHNVQQGGAERIQAEKEQNFEENPDQVPAKETELKATANKFGDMIFCDYEYIKVPSIKNEFQYALVFIDTATRYVHSYLTKDRDNTVKVLEKYIRDIKSTIDPGTRQTRAIAVIQADNAKEFVDRKWKDVCAKHQIQARYPGAHLHQSQAIVERVLRTLQDMTRAMLHTAHCPQSEWEFAWQHAVHIYNRLPHDHFDNKKCPLEAYSGYQPTYNRLKVFGCAAYSYKEVQSGKLDTRAEPLIYVGSNEHNTHKLYNRASKTVLDNKGHVKFDENIQTEGGRLITAPHLTDTLAFIHNESLSEMPENLQSYNDMEIGKIIDSQIYYDENTQEATALFSVQLRKEGNQKQNNNEQCWVQANELVTKGTGCTTQKNPRNKHWKHNINKMKSYVLDEQNREKLSKHSEMFQVIGFTTAKTEIPVLIIGTYKSASDKLTYKMCKLNEQNDDLSLMINSLRNNKLNWNYEYNPPTVNAMMSRFHNFADQEWYLGETPDSLKDMYTNAYNMVNSMVETDINRSFLTYIEPLTYQQAIHDQIHKEGWQEATDKEMRQFDTLKAMIPAKWEDIKDENIVDSKVVYKLKLLANGEIEKYKARLVARGFTQQYGVDYFENFSPTPQIGGIRIVIGFILHHQLKRARGDVTGAFLNATLKEKIFLKLPRGIKFKGSEYVQLLKSCYGLKQAGRDWNDMQHEIISKFDPELKRSKTDPCIYFKITKEHKFILSVHVDDYIIGYDSQDYFDKFVKHYNEHVPLTIDSEVDFILQMKINWHDEKVTMDQNRMITTLAMKHGLSESSKAPKTPMPPGIVLTPKAEDEDYPEGCPYPELVCAMLFIARYTRPDILFHITYLCRFLTTYTRAHWKQAMNVLRYLKHTMENIKLTYVRQPNSPTLSMYMDADWAGDPEDRKSTAGAIVFYHGNPVGWISQKQKTVSTSTSEAEYKTMTYAFKEGMYYYNLMEKEFKLNTTPIPTKMNSLNPVIAYGDNKGAIFMVKQRVSNNRSKHIDIDYHYAREKVQDDKTFTVEYVPTADNCADIFTKCVNAYLHDKHCNFIFKRASS